MLIQALKEFFETKHHKAELQPIHSGFGLLLRSRNDHFRLLKLILPPEAPHLVYIYYHSITSSSSTPNPIDLRDPNALDHLARIAYDWIKEYKQTGP